MAFNYVDSDFSNESFIISGVYASVCKSHQAHLEVDTCARESSLHPVSALISLANLFGILSSPIMQMAVIVTRLGSIETPSRLSPPSLPLSLPVVYRCSRI